MFNFIWSLLQELYYEKITKIKKTREIEEKKAIALVFNNRYTCRAEYLPENGFISGATYPHYAWMCPTCNRIHITWMYNHLDGPIYEACCEFPSGPRVID